jgi:hypothetical protein
MHRILSAITDLTATEPDLKMLEELCDLLKNTSLCGLGQSAPNPVVSTLKSFAEEYRAHIQDKKCAAGVCGAHENVGDEKHEEKHEVRELSEVGV